MSVIDDSGEYDAEATWVRKRTKAVGVVLVVIGGDRGHGLSAQATSDLTLHLPSILRKVADEIEAEMKKR
jgi:hypothetical protein